MKLFLDTNIMLDFLGERVPFYTSSAQIASLADQRKISIFVSALSFATVSYFLTKYEGAEKAKNKLRKFKIISKVCELDELIIEKALNSNFTDFEDALQYYSALRYNCNILITRNGKDFKLAKIPIMTSDEYIKSLVLD